jgi:1,4-dihydroxy-2-naphthoyl-CoA hydrolase
VTAAPVEGPNHWDEALGLDIVEWGPERVRARVVIERRHQQPYGIVHGGVYASIVESVASHGAAAARPEAGGVVGVSNTTDFLRPHRDGPLDVLGTPVFVGRTQQLWQVEITRPADGKLVARGQVRLQNLTDVPEHR